jgi:hypothetical protein
MVKIRCVGRQTAELTILRELDRADAFPGDDIGVRRFVSQFYRDGEKISSSPAQEFADRRGHKKKGLLRSILMWQTCWGSTLGMKRDLQPDLVTTMVNKKVVNRNIPLQPSFHTALFL